MEHLKKLPVIHQTFETTTLCQYTDVAVDTVFTKIYTCVSVLIS